MRRILNVKQGLTLILLAVSSALATGLHAQQTTPPNTSDFDWQDRSEAGVQAMCAALTTSFGDPSTCVSRYATLQSACDNYGRSDDACHFVFINERVYEECQASITCYVSYARDSRDRYFPSGAIPWPTVSCHTTGQRYDAELRSCTDPRRLTDSTVRESRTVACPAGQTGGIEEYREGFTPQYGWVLSLDPFAEEITHRGQETWGAWQVDPDVPSTCRAAPSDDRPWADLVFESNPANPFRAELIISQSGGGCTSGYTFNPTYNGCVRTRSDSESRSCTPSPTSSYVSGSGRQTRSRTLWQHQNAAFGSTVGGYPRIVSTGSWGSWSTCSGGTPLTSPPSTGPAVNDTYYFRTDLICGSGDAGYNYDPVGTPEQKVCITSSFRSSVLSTYRNHGYGRCPERGGFEHWIWANLEIYSTQGLSCSLVQNQVRERINQAFVLNGDDGSWGCQAEANRRWPPAGSVTAVMVAGSGRQCRITSVK